MKKLNKILKRYLDYLQIHLSNVGVLNEEEFFEKQEAIKADSWHKWDDINSLIDSIIKLKTTIKGQK